MDIEREIEFDWAKFKVEVPSKSKFNIINGYYIKDKYDAQVFYELIQHGKIVRYKDYLVCNRFIIDLKTDTFVFFPSNNGYLYDEGGVSIGYFNRYEHRMSLRKRYYFYEITHKCYIMNTLSIKEKLQYDWTIELRRVGRIDNELLIQAINESIKKAKNDSGSVQETCVEVF